MVILLIGIPMICIVFQDFYHCSRSDIIRRGFCKSFLIAIPGIIGAFIVYCLGATFAIILCEVVLFAPFAFFCYIVCHSRYTYETRSIVSKKAFDFIMDNKSLFSPVDRTILGINILKIDDINHDSKNTINNKDNEDNKGNKDENKENDEKENEKDSTNDNCNNHSNNNQASMANSKLNLKLIDRRLIYGKDERLFRLIFINYCFIHHFDYIQDWNWTVSVAGGQRPKYSLIEFLDKHIDTEWCNFKTITRKCRW